MDLPIHDRQTSFFQDDDLVRGGDTESSYFRHEDHFLSSSSSSASPNPLQVWVCLSYVQNQIAFRASVKWALQDVPSAHEMLGWLGIFSVPMSAPFCMALWEFGRSFWWNTQIKISPTQVHGQMGNPVHSSSDHIWPHLPQATAIYVPSHQHPQLEKTSSYQDERWKLAKDESKCAKDKTLRVLQRGDSQFLG